MSLSIDELSITIDLQKEEVHMKGAESSSYNDSRLLFYFSSKMPYNVFYFFANNFPRNPVRSLPLQLPKEHNFLKSHDMFNLSIRRRETSRSNYMVFSAFHRSLSFFCIGFSIATIFRNEV